jgi:hypothetical protein
MRSGGAVRRFAAAGAAAGACVLRSERSGLKKWLLGNHLLGPETGERGCRRNRVREWLLGNQMRTRIDSLRTPACQRLPTRASVVGQSEYPRVTWRTYVSGWRW